MTQEKRTITTSNVGDVCVALLLESEYGDESHALKTGAALLKLVNEHGFERIIVDFTGVQSIGSAFIGELMRLTTKTQEQGGHKVRCCSFTENASAILNVVGLKRADSPVLCLETADQALASFSE